MRRQETARRTWRIADASNRIKEALKARLYPYHDRKYESGEEIAFLDEKESWQGPAKVLGMDGKTIHVMHNGQFRKVASCRAR